jgi:hypothetical protein
MQTLVKKAGIHIRMECHVVQVGNLRPIVNRPTKSKPPSELK